MSDDANLQWFDKLQARDFANGAVIDAIRRVFKEHAGHRTQLATAQAEVERLNKECGDNQDWINSLCKELCTMEDALGFANDQHDQTGRWVPTIGLWLERVRDLIAAEGELGDVKADLTKRDEAVERLKAAYERSESERLFAQGRMENQLNQKLQLKLELEKRDEVLRAAKDALEFVFQGPPSTDTQKSEVINYALAKIGELK